MRLSTLYAERQRLGLQLASSGGALVVPVPGEGANRTASEGGGDEDTSDVTATGSKTASGASDTTAAVAYTVGISAPDSASFPTQGARVVDMLHVTEALKRSVQDEIALKMDMSKTLMAERLNVRAARGSSWRVIRSSRTPRARDGAQAAGVRLRIPHE